MQQRFFTGINGYDEFAQFVALPIDSATQRRAALEASFMPFRVSHYYARLIRDLDGPDREALLNIVTAPIGSRPFVGRFDPYGNMQYANDRNAFLQHKYPRTLLVHITDYCTAHCQFCYKVNEIKITHNSNAASTSKIDQTLAYLREHPEIENILFTGGDPGSIRPDLLQSYIAPLLEQPGIRALRFATKSIAFDPALLADESLLQFFSRMNHRHGKQIAVIAQVNHPAELTAEAGETLRRLRAADVQVRGQPAVISGVNADAPTLARLMRSFLDHKIISYYYTLFMPVRGVEQYAVKIHDGLRAFQTAAADVSGLEKKGTLLISHDYGKVEVLGMLSGQIVLRWHEVVAPDYLPPALRAALPHAMGDVFTMSYPADGAYSFDDLLRHNDLPAFTPDGLLQLTGRAP